MSKGDKELVNKIIDLFTIHQIQESNLYLKMLDNQIKVQQNHIKYLEDTKPFFFQKKKLEKYNKEIEKCEQKIYETYKKMNEEVDFIFEMKNSIDNE